MAHHLTRLSPACSHTTSGRPTKLRFLPHSHHFQRLSLEKQPLLPDVHTGRAHTVQYSARCSLDMLRSAPPMSGPLLLPSHQALTRIATPRPPPPTSANYCCAVVSLPHKPPPGARENRRLPLPTPLALPPFSTPTSRFWLSCLRRFVDWHLCLFNAVRRHGCRPRRAHASRGRP